MSEPFTGLYFSQAQDSDDILGLIRRLKRVIQFMSSRNGSSEQRTISVRGAREHNLMDVNIDMPRDKLVVITGLSGSGKSSLAFDTIYAEGQRRYVESLSA